MRGITVRHLLHNHSSKYELLTNVEEKSKVLADIYCFLTIERTIPYTKRSNRHKRLTITTTIYDFFQSEFFSMQYYSPYFNIYQRFVEEYYIDVERMRVAINPTDTVVLEPSIKHFNKVKKVLYDMVDYLHEWYIDNYNVYNACEKYILENGCTISDKLSLYDALAFFCSKHRRYPEKNFNGNKDYVKKFTCDRKW